MKLKKWAVAGLAIVLIICGTVLARAAWRSANLRQLPIFMYHHIVEDGGETGTDAITVSQLREELTALKNLGFTAVTTQEVVEFAQGEGSLPKKPVCITFDDGYLSNYELAYPILKELDMKATIFVIGATMGSKEHYKDTEFTITPHFGEEEMTEMLESGLVCFQSHTYDLHQWRPFESGDEIRTNVLPLEQDTEESYAAVLTEDVLSSRAQLENITGQSVSALAYPGGKYTEQSEQILHELGFAMTLTTDNGSNLIKKGDPTSLYLLKRRYVTDQTDMETFTTWANARVKG